ncbi:MAG: zf-TFIIB domain-containing protein [Myxococcales bacterium]|nr:zf-TFIIB domain-containing protein [Myxococcales bacterium]
MDDRLVCARCGSQLRAGTYKGIPVHHCAACEGVLVRLRHNVPLLEQLAQDLAPDVDVNTPIAAHDGPTGVATCPVCRRAMERFGYMGTQTVFFDRCGQCEVVFIDGDEIRTAAAVYARTQRRSDDRKTFLGHAAAMPETPDEHITLAHARMRARLDLPSRCPECAAPVAAAETELHHDGTATCRYCSSRLGGP